MAKKKKNKKKDKKEKSKKGFKGNLIESLENLQNLYLEKVDVAFSEFDLSSEQFRILSILSEAPEDGYSLRQIREALPNQTSNATRLVEKLRLKKFVTKKASRTDKRELRIALTVAGEEVHEQAGALIEEIDSSVNKGLKNKDAEVVIKALDKISASLQN